MIIDKDGNTTIITQEKASIIELVKKIDILYDRFKNNNIIVNITKLDDVKLSDVVENKCVFYFTKCLYFSYSLLQYS